MARQRTKYVCQSCGYETPRWFGRCPDCGEWNSLLEVIDTRIRPGNSSAHMAGQKTGPVLLQSITTDGEVRIRTGLRELNRVLGGGIVPGQVVLLGGDPGIGKSTLLLQMAFLLTAKGVRVLYVTGEESLQQMKLRADRLGLDQGSLYTAAETDVTAIEEHIAAVKPQVVITDSVQTLVAPELSSAPGSVSQVRECAGRLLRLAKNSGIAVFLVGHVTKEGSIGSAA